jgi:hypothetical protein
MGLMVKLAVAKQKDEKAEVIADTWGHVQVVRLTSKRGQRLVIAMNLEDDTLSKAHDPADKQGLSKHPTP